MPSLVPPSRKAPPTHPGAPQQKPWGRQELEREVARGGRAQHPGDCRGQGPLRDPRRVHTHACPHGGPAFRCLLRYASAVISIDPQRGAQLQVEFWVPTVASAEPCISVALPAPERSSILRNRGGELEHRHLRHMDRR